MKKLVLIGVAGFICFSGAAAISWFVLPKPAEDGQPEMAAGVASDSQTGAESAGDANVVGMRNSQPASPEQLFRQATLLEKQHKGLIRQREILEQQEGRLKLLQKDVDNYKREIDGAYTMLRDRIGAGEKLVEELRDQQQRLEMLQKKNESQTKEINQGDAGRDATAAEAARKSPRWLGGMDAEQAAKVLREMSDNGTMDAAVELLVKIEDRTVSKILAALNDPKLVAELMTGIREARGRSAANQRLR